MSAPDGTTPSSPDLPNPDSPATATPDPASPGADVLVTSGEPNRNNKLPLLITAVVLVIALAATGIVYFANRSANIAAGATSPAGAVENLVTAINDNDPLGIAEVLDPVEATQATYMTDTVLSELKRLNILDASTDLDDTFGLTISLTDVTYGETSPVTDQVTVVEVTGGALTIEANPNRVPLSDKIRAALPADASDDGVQRETTDLADATNNGDKHIRIAAVNRHGSWYPSMMYSIFDNIAVEQFGTDYPQHPEFTTIPALGTDSPEAAMTAFVDALAAGDTDRLLGLLAPEEMGAVHDYVNLLNSKSNGSGPSEDIFSASGISITDPKWALSDAVSTKDGVKVSFTSFTITSQDQAPITVTRDIDAGTLTVSTPGEPTMTYSADTIVDMVESGFDSLMSLGTGFAAGFDADGNFDFDEDFDSDADSNFSAMGMSPEVRDLVERIYRTLIDTGIVMTQAEDSLWYISPVGSVSEIFVALLQTLEPADIDYFLSLGDE